MNFDPVDRDFDIYSESQRPRPWSGKVKVTIEFENDNFVFYPEITLDHAHDEEDAIEQIRDIIAHQTHIQIL